MAYYGISNNILYLSGTSSSPATTNFSWWGVYPNEPPWHSQASSITSVVIKNSLTGATSLSRMFHNMSALTNISGLNYLDTSNVIDMSEMFSGCSLLTSIDLSNFNTNNLKSDGMAYQGVGAMFKNCSSLTSLDLSNFNTSNCEDLRYMFSGCSSLTSLDLSNFNTSRVKGMIQLFALCSSLASVNIGSFDTSNCENMETVFYGCSSLTSLDVSNFNTSNCTRMYGMFYGCSALTSLNVNSFNTEKVNNMSGMFGGCTTLERIYSNKTWVGANEVNDDIMFNGSTSLKGAISYDETKDGVAYANPYTGYFTPLPAPTKVIYANNTVIDLSQVNVIPSALAAGYTAHDKFGNQITGTGTFTVGESTGGGTAGVSRVVCFGKAKIDLMGDTVTEGSLLEGYKAINRAGMLLNGTSSETPTTQSYNITASNISTYFTVSNSSYYFAGSGGTFTTNNAGVSSSTAQTTLTAKANMDISFNYSYSSESNYDKFTLTVGGTTVENAVSGTTTTKTYSGSLTAGQQIVFKYTKDGSVNKNNDQCTFSNMVVTQ